MSSPANALIHWLAALLSVVTRLTHELYGLHHNFKTVALDEFCLPGALGRPILQHCLRFFRIRR
eukprot:12747425-Alexandrium_andersonii.AAC.1